tara:strand:- start:34503 stop:34685 length:183 start_codon:yes stop_codon:yes gene_type:complete
MEKREREIFLLDAKIAGINTEIIVLKTSDDREVVNIRKSLRKKVGALEKKRKERKKALQS